MHVRRVIHNYETARLFTGRRILRRLSRQEQRYLRRKQAKRQ